MNTLPPALPKQAPQPGTSRRGPWIALAILFVPVVWFCCYHISLSANISARLTALQRANEPVTLAQLNSYYPQVPVSSNAASAYQQAFEVIQKTKSSEKLEKISGLPHGSSPLPVELRTNMEALCAQNADALAALREGAQMNHARYPVDYTPGWGTLLPHLRNLPPCCALELCSGVLAEQRGDIPETISSIQTISKACSSLNPEPDLISALIQFRMHAQASELLSWLLNHRQLSPEQLTVLRQSFENAIQTTRLQCGIIGERCMVLAVFQCPTDKFLDTVDPQRHENPFAVALGLQVLRISGALKKDNLRYLDCMQQLHEAMQLPILPGLDRVEEIRQQIKKEAVQKRSLLTGSYVPSFVKAFEKNAIYTARQALVLTAIAIEQYHLAHNHFPGSLAELSPELLPQVPLDPFSNDSLRYRRQTNSFLLYSVGPDRVDNAATNSITLSTKGEHPPGDIIFAVSRPQS